MVILLRKWQAITKVLSTTLIKNKKEYEEVTLKDLAVNIKDFKTAAKQTIYTANTGDDPDAKNKNFYCHVLTKYMILIAKETLKKYKLGTGIYSMQGFERRNKESKNCAQRFCSYKKNVCVSIILRLFDLFYYGQG